MSARSLPEFREHLIASDLKGGYQVVAVDLNKDGRQDLIALGSGMSELVWFENPGWQRRIIATGLSRMINVASADIDGDGIPELVLASAFNMEPSKSAGVISVLKHKGDPREPWDVTEIDRLPASHRLRFARVGDTAPVAVNVPLAGAMAAPPDYREKAPIVLYRPGDWKRELISDELEGVAHGMAVIDWNGDGRDDLLTASFQGIHLFRREGDGRWRSTRLAAGSPDAWPKCGASEIAPGRLGQRRFLCSIEPWHGHLLAVYLERGGTWERRVIDDTLVHGHALTTADLDADGLDEIIAGFRGEKKGVYIYAASSDSGESWTRHPLDAELAASACAVADFNDDGRPDLACISGTTLKWYENVGVRAGN